MVLNVDQIDLPYIFRTFHSKAAEYTFFSDAHGTFSRIGYMLVHKSGLNKNKMTEIIPCIVSYVSHDAMKHELNHKKKIGEDCKYMKVRQNATKQQISQQGNQRRKNTWKQMKMKSQQSKIFVMQQKRS